MGWLPGIPNGVGPLQCQRSKFVGNVNRKSTRDENAHLKAVVSAAFPDCDVIVGGHGDYGGHRAPRDHTLSFRVRGLLFTHGGLSPHNSVAEVDYPHCTERFVKAPSIQNPVMGKVVLGLSSATAPAETRSGA